MQSVRKKNQTLKIILWLIVFAIVIIAIIFIALKILYREKPLQYPPVNITRLKRPEKLFEKGTWNTKIPENPTIHEQSANYIALMDYVAQSQGYLMSYKKWTVPVYAADENTPRYTVPLMRGDWVGESDLNIADVPIPIYAAPDPASSGITSLFETQTFLDFKEATIGDASMAIIDTQKGWIYEFWQMRNIDGQWKASWGNKLPIKGTGIYPCGLSARGSGASLIAGLVWPEELERGYIDHVLYFSFPFNDSRGPIRPMTETDGLFTPETLQNELSKVEGSEQFLPLPEGLLLQLDPSIDLSAIRIYDEQTNQQRALFPWEITIAKALQEYGMINIDNSGSTINMYAVHAQSNNPQHYQNILPDQDYIHLPLEWVSQFRVINTGSRVENNTIGLTQEQWTYYQCDLGKCNAKKTCYP